MFDARPCLFVRQYKPLPLTGLGVYDPYRLTKPAASGVQPTARVGAIRLLGAGRGTR
jgi:hypothetical protein